MIKLGLLGQSLAHTLSPVIHRAFFDELGLVGCYDKIEVSGAELIPSRLQELAAEGYSGLNVTIPYKLDVIAALASLDESAAIAGAVNTIVLAAPACGFNTDSSGLAEAIDSYQLPLPNLNASAALILGNGGAARAAVIAVSSLGYKNLTLCSRDVEKARTMLDELASNSQRVSLVNNCRTAKTMALTDFAAPAAGFDLTINATPVGQKDNFVPPDFAQLLQAIAAATKNPDSLAFVDLVYARDFMPTPLCRVASASGFGHCHDGLEMLLNQARLAFKIWTGHLPGLDLARERLRSI